MSLYFIFEKLGIALMLGFLVGLQREKAESLIGGFRTFPLVTLLGAFCALLAEHYGASLILGGLFALTTFVILGNVAAMRSGADRSGITTEVAMLVMYFVGASLITGRAVISLAVAGCVAVLLQFKPELHGFAKRLDHADLRAIMRFVLLSFIILPVLPNEEFGPFSVLNPREIWMMVVFIVGLNLTGYILSKFVGKTAGTFMSGILGGLISSTATTVSFSQSSKKDKKHIPRAATIILIASTLVYIRVTVEIAGVSKALFDVTIVPIAILFGVSLALSIVSYLTSKSEYLTTTQHEAPSGTRTALVFAATYAIVVFATAAAKHYLGPSSLYWVAGVSGLTDVDAITLSTARLVAAQKLAPEQAKQMVLIGILSNLVFKTGMVGVLGSGLLLARVALFFGVCVATGLLLIFV